MLIKIKEYLKENKISFIFPGDCSLDKLRSSKKILRVFQNVELSLRIRQKTEEKVLKASQQNPFTIIIRPTKGNKVISVSAEPNIYKIKWKKKQKKIKKEQSLIVKTITKPHYILEIQNFLN